METVTRKFKFGKRYTPCLNTPSYASQTSPPDSNFDHRLFNLVGTKFLGEQISLLVVGIRPFNFDVVGSDEVIDKIECSHQVTCLLS